VKLLGLDTADQVHTETTGTGVWFMVFFKVTFTIKGWKSVAYEVLYHYCKIITIKHVFGTFVKICIDISAARFARYSEKRGLFQNQPPIGW